MAYGLEKYPEPLNADTWSIIETIDHIIDETIDKLHYLVMLRIKFENENREKDRNVTFNIDIPNNMDADVIARQMEKYLSNLEKEE